ncbi:MAG: hypothetical protein MHPSP_004923, partial [Paramarteilia canceri]
IDAARQRIRRILGIELVNIEKRSQDALRASNNRNTGSHKTLSKRRDVNRQLISIEEIER